MLRVAAPPPAGANLSQAAFRIRGDDTALLNADYGGGIPAGAALTQAAFRLRANDTALLNAPYNLPPATTALEQAAFRLRDGDAVALNEPYGDPEGESPDVMPVGIPGPWTLAMQDEFATGTLNTAIWRPGWFSSTISNPVNSYEGQGYNATHVTLPGDGYLHLRLTDADILCPDGVTRPYTGGMVSSNPNDGRGAGGYQFAYGAVEARVYIPALTGSTLANWPAVWTNGQSPWPSNGEIDIMEGLGGRAAWHYHVTNSHPGSHPSGDWTGWHTFACSWDPGLIVFYWDGVNVGSTSTNVGSSPHYLVLNNALASPTSSYILAPADMLVDYIRVWQRP